MKILMFGMSSIPGGIENFIKNYFLNEFSAERLSITFVSYEDTIAYNEEIKRYGYEVIFVPNQKKHPLGYLSSIKKILSSNKYDIAYFNVMSAANILPVIYAKKANCRIVVHSHNGNVVTGLLRQVLSFLNKKRMNHITDIRIACSEEAGKALFNDSGFTVVNNAIKLDKYSFDLNNRISVRNKYGIPKEAVVLGNVGRLCDQKNQTFLIELFSNLIRNNQNYYLMVIGNGPLEDKLFNSVKANRIEKNVIFVKNCSDVSAFYSAFDYFVLTSIFEGLPISIIEAQTSGLRCFLSTNIDTKVDVTGQCTFIPLDKPEIWTEKLSNLKSQCNSRENSYYRMLNGDYDITKQLYQMIEVLNS